MKVKTYFNLLYTAMAGWLICLMTVDDEGNEMPLSSDSMLDELTP